jgi:hypothetical protein
VSGCGTGCGKLKGKVLVDTSSSDTVKDLVGYLVSEGNPARDQIFSVLGLVKGTVLQEDYSLSIHDTYMAAPRTCILKD